MKTTGNQERLHYIDWLRVIAILTVFCFHAAMIFVSWGWHIKNTESSFIMDTLVRFIHLWIMPLFFLIAGASTWGSLRTRSERSYIWERFKRLMIPLFWGIVLIVPPQVYVERLSTSAFHGSLFQFYYYFFNGIYPAGNFTLNHLWFLVYLFVISLLALPGLPRLKTISEKYILKILPDDGTTPWVLFLPALPLVAIELLFRYLWPFYLQPADVLLFLLYFIYGYLIASVQKIKESIVRFRIPAGISSLISFGVIVTLYALQKIPAPGSTWGYVIFRIFWSATAWLCIAAILGFGITYFTFKHKIIKYANEAVLPFYILHQTIILVVAYYVVPWDMNLYAKYFLIVTTSFFITTLLYLGIRQSKTVRLVFGLRRSNKSTM